MASETKEEKVYKNKLFHQVFQKLIMSRTPDVHFIFESEGDEEAIKIPAHKDVLAVMSPVFDTMFNGELKEKGDVKIVDVSSAAFEEFLQFFYNDQVKLTMENIDDVLNLAHKYDVTDCFQMAIAFLKEHLNSENLVLGLQLAMKYESDDLKVFCKRGIENEPKALDAFKAEEQQISSNNAHFTLIDAFAIAKEIIFKQSAELERFRSNCVFQFVVSCIDDTIYTDAMISPVETLKLNSIAENSSLWLREIHFTKVFTKCGSKYQSTQLNGTISVVEEFESDSKTIFEQQFGMNSDENYIKLSEPIKFNSDVFLKIIVKTSVCGYPIAIYRDSLYYPYKLTICDKPEYSLIDHLYFEEFPR